MVSGCLYSIGVGPGDPELMTLKAVHTISKCPVLVLPAESRQKCVAYQIARQILPEIDEKEAVCLVMPMTKDKEKLERNHEEGAVKVAQILEEGRDAAFLTIGDPTVYATSAGGTDGISDTDYQWGSFFLCCCSKTGCFSGRKAGADTCYTSQLRY